MGVMQLERAPGVAVRKSHCNPDRGLRTLQDFRRKLRDWRNITEERRELLDLGAALGGGSKERDSVAHSWT